MTKKRVFVFFSLASLALLLAPAVANAGLLETDAIGIAQTAETAGSALLLVTVIGVLYSLWKTTQAYGGLIGAGLRRIGFGIVFLSVEALDRVAQSFGTRDLLASLVPAYFLQNLHDALLLLGLFFLMLGFSKLSSAVKG